MVTELTNRLRPYAGLAVVLLFTYQLAACQSTGGSFCQIASPIRPTQADNAVISDQLVRQIVVLNETGEKLCKWKP